MPVVRPERWVHRGRVLAVGVVVDPRLCGEAEARRRIVGLFAAGCQVNRGPAGLTLRWASPRELVEPYPGAPLVVIGSSTVTTTLSAEEVPGAPSFARVVDGDLVELVLGPAEDPASWLGVDLPTLDAIPLGVLAVARDVIPAMTFGAADLGVSGLHGGRDALALALGNAPAAPPPPSGIGPVTGLKALFRGLFGGGAPTTPTSSAPGSVAAGAGLDAWLASVGGRLGLDRWLGADHGAYLDDLLDRFRGGDLLEALRRAIPLGGSGQGGPPAFSLPTPRADLGLSLSARAIGPARSIGAGPSVYELLRKLYTAAAERLEADGAYEQAAFVYDELLGAPAAAVAMLERRGLVGVAARLAEVRGLEPGLIVRLWWMAGDKQRAVALARLWRAFPDAIARLDADGRSSATLRTAWARALADAGSWVAAVDAASALPSGELQDEVTAWIDAALAEGGRDGALLLPRRFARAREDWPRLRPFVDAWTAPTADPSIVAALFDGIEAVPSALPTLVRHTVRRALAMPDVQVADLIRVARRTGLPITDDLRGLPGDTASGPPSPAFLRVTELGSTPIVDLVGTADGGALVATGEAGVLRLDAAGRTRAHFDWPATAIVANPAGNRFVLIARSGAWSAGAVRLARLALGDLGDLGDRGAVVRPWADVRLSRFAPWHDGDTWYVADGEDLLAADLLADDWRLLWTARGLRAPIRALQASDVELHAVVGSEVWRWPLSRRTLSARLPINGADELVDGKLALDNGRLLAWGLRHPARGPGWRLGEDHTYNEDVTAACAGGTQRPARIVVREYGVELVCAHARVELHGATFGGVRAAGERVWAFDDQGRFVVSTPRRTRAHRLVV